MPSKSPTLTAAIHHAARLGLTLRLTDFGEYRINFARGPEATAVYEDSLAEAMAAGMDMLARRYRLERELCRMGVPAAKAATDAISALTL